MYFCVWERQLYLTAELLFNVGLSEVDFDYDKVRWICTGSKNWATAVDLTEICDGDLIFGNFIELESYLIHFWD